MASRQRPMQDAAQEEIKTSRFDHDLKEKFSFRFNFIQRSRGIMDDAHVADPQSWTL
jgi:hypothetical protein